jgi:hypothetical protein
MGIFKRREQGTSSSISRRRRLWPYHHRKQESFLSKRASLLGIPRELRDDIIFWSLLDDCKAAYPAISCLDSVQRMQNIVDRAEATEAANWKHYHLDYKAEEDAADQVRLRLRRVSSVCSLRLACRQLHYETNDTLNRNRDLFAVAELDLLINCQMEYPKRLVNWTPTVGRFSSMFDTLKIRIRLPSFIDDDRTAHLMFRVDNNGVKFHFNRVVQSFLKPTVEPIDESTLLSGRRTPVRIHFDIICPDEPKFTGESWNIAAKQDLRSKILTLPLSTMY